MAILTLRFDPREIAPGRIVARWSIDDRPVGPAIALKEGKAAKFAMLLESYLASFEQVGRPYVSTDLVAGIGQALFDTWFRPAWGDLGPAIDAAGHRELRIASEDTSIANWPWELVELTSGDPIGCDASWSIAREEPGRVLNPLPIRAGPLRVVFLTSAPTDRRPLDYDREEEAILKVTSRLGGHAAVVMAESGRVDELRELVARVRPQIVHLSGHGSHGPDDRGEFLFEDENARADAHDAASLYETIFAGSDVRCVFVNGCLSSQAGVAGLCRALARAGLPLALGWAEEVADDLATAFAESFYRDLVAGETVAASVARARKAIRKDEVLKGGEMKQDVTFALPRVYAAAACIGAPIFDRSAPVDTYDGPRTRHMTLGDRITGLSEGFVGRRRELRTLLPALREGSTTFLVLTGIGGAGKSTLATRLVNRLEQDGFLKVPIRAEGIRGNDPETVGRNTVDKIVKTLQEVFHEHGHLRAGALLGDGALPIEERLSAAARTLGNPTNDAGETRRFVLVLDNLEDAIDLDSRRIVHAPLERFYRELANGVVQGSRIIITCRYLPAATPSPDETPTVIHVEPREFEKFEFLKFLRGDDRVEERIRGNELPDFLLDKLYNVLGGTPGFLVVLRDRVASIDPEVLLDGLDGFAPDPAGELRERYFERLVLERLYRALSPDGQVLASRLAISRAPLPVDALARIGHLDEDAASRAIADCVNYGMAQRFEDHDGPTLYHPPGLIRPWLAGPERLDPADATRVHGRIAEFWKNACEEARASTICSSIHDGLNFCFHHAFYAAEPKLIRWHWKARLELIRQYGNGKATAMAEDLYCLQLQLDAKEDYWLQILPDYAEKYAFTAGEESALADYELRHGDRAEARRRYGLALAKYRAAGDPPGDGESFMISKLAELESMEGNHSEACRLMEEAIEIGRSSEDHNILAYLYLIISGIAREMGDRSTARRHLEESIYHGDRCPDRGNAIGSLDLLTLEDFIRGDQVAAKRRLGEVLAGWRESKKGTGAPASLRHVTELNWKGRVGDLIQLELLCRLYDMHSGQIDLIPSASTDIERLLYLLEKYGIARDEQEAISIFRRVGDAYDRDGGRELVEQILNEPWYSEFRRRLRRGWERLRSPWAKRSTEGERPEG